MRSLVGANEPFGTEVGNDSAVERWSNVFQGKRRVRLETISPVSADGVGAGDGFQSNAPTMDDGVVRLHGEQSVNIRITVGVQLVNRSGHRVKGHIPHLHAKATRD
jgi:hypothetical protein